MAERFTAALVQTTSTRDITENLAALAPRVHQAARDGAELVLLPENAALLEPVSRLLREKALPEEQNAAIAGFRDLARAAGVWLLAGSVAVRQGDRVANRSVLFDREGAIVARYDKIHLFDVDLGNGEFYRESATIAPGNEAVVATTPWGAMGLTVCYDLRFPHLFRALAKAGAQFITVPAAFTRTTGRAHWHVLLRARAIENGCFVLAPAQCGVHAEDRETYGHSLVVDPWGEVLLDAGEEPGVFLVEIDLSRVDDARRRVPSLSHDRPFESAPAVDVVAERALS